MHHSSGLKHEDSQKNIFEKLHHVSIADHGGARIIITILPFPSLSGRRLRVAYTYSPIYTLARIGVQLLRRTFLIGPRYDLRPIFSSAIRTKKKKKIEIVHACSHRVFSSSSYLLSRTIFGECEFSAEMACQRSRVGRLINRRARGRNDNMYPAVAAARGNNGVFYYSIFLIYITLVGASRMLSRRGRNGIKYQSLH